MVMSVTESLTQAQRAHSTSPLREYTASYRAELFESLNVPGGIGGRELARKHAMLADELVRRVFEDAWQGGDECQLLLGAVGSYGRGLLALGSDLDLCFVTSAPRQRVADCVEALLYPLWDAGLQVGHQIVHPSEVTGDAAADIAMATELLDFRPLAGDIALHHVLIERLSESTFSEAQVGGFINQLEADGKKRHSKFGDSVYLLEPDIKNGTGGLRDLDAALWAARARFGTSKLSELYDMGLITEKMQQDAERALDFLWTVRNHLHKMSGRKMDRLTFTEQERVAAKMGYGRRDEAGIPQLQRIGEMVEAFMSDYYRHARIVCQTSHRILGRAKRSVPGFSPEVRNLGGGLVECGGRLGLTDPERIVHEPELAFRVFAAAVERDTSILSRTRDAISVATADPDVCHRLRSSRAASDLFIALLCSSKEVSFASGSILTELHDVGLLLAMVPEFAPLVGRVHHDIYHVYTVDVHSIAAVDRLHALVRGELVHSFTLASRLAAEVKDKRVLFMAMLLHDVGKAIGGKNHARRGADMARDILARFSFSEDEIEDVSRLILHHLTMYMVAIRRDLNDPGTVREFVRETWDHESLRDLFLLTVADVSTTSTQAMTRWKLDMLSALYRSSEAYLSGSLVGRTSRVERIRRAVCERWTNAETLADLERFLDSMPDRYFLANSPQEVIAHAELALQSAEDAVAVSWMPSSHAGIFGLCVVAETTENLDLCIVTKDRRGLLTSIAAAISASHFDIQAAQINSRRLSSGGYQALDLFWLRNNGPESARERRLDKLKKNLARVVSGEIAPEVLVEQDVQSSRIPRPTPKVVTEVLFDHHASDEYTVIEVLAEDRPSLLFTLSRTLRELSVAIGVAKISTEGTRAVDVLYVSEMDGTKLAAGARSDEVRSRLLDALRTNAS